MKFDDLYPRLGQIGELGAIDLRVPDAEALLIPALGSRSTPAFNAHSYHTKIPPEAIEPYIRHYTKPGAVVLDPFAGSGMTGVAARRNGRRAVLNDLAPAAAHLAWNMTHYVDPRALRSATNRIAGAISTKLDEIYRSRCVECGGVATIAFTIWSEHLACGGCGVAISVWDHATDKATGRVSQVIRCPDCSSVASRRSLKRVDRKPAWVATDCVRCGRIERPADRDDVCRSEYWATETVADWYPNNHIEPSREMYIRSALGLRGIRSVADFYTPRNLHALSGLWSAIADEPDQRLRQALAFAFTNTAWHGTVMRRYNARGGQRPLTGTLYVPHLSSEANVWKVFNHKIQQLERFYGTEWSVPEPPGGISVIVGSATHLPAIPDRSIDYCFTDPPFGSNIFYADCNLIWESWLGSLTDMREEAVVNRSQNAASGGKTVTDYAALMRSSFAEMARVLRPDAWLTVVFHSTDANVWTALEESARDAGLEITGATHMDKTQLSHKGYKGRNGSENVAAYDVVLALRNRRVLRSRERRRQEAVSLLSTHLSALPPLGADPVTDRQRTLPYLHSLLIQHHFNGDIGVHVGDFDIVRALCAANFTQDESGYWTAATDRSAPPLST